LNEVNHRVKNNLATIIGLLYTERNRAELKDNPAFQDVIHNLSNRVRGLATVHTMLSASGWQPLQLGKLVEQVARAALRATPPGKYAAVTVSPVKIAIPPGQANNLAIVINELATNSVKHTCEEQNIIQITVNLQQTGDLVELEFRDDGPGYPDRVLRSNYKNVGLYLIQNIVEEGLNGTLALSNDGGAVTNITFKLDAPEE
ncbi:MAG: sensor histidine kinase, partial [Anaerolineae bacterium]